VTRLSVALMAHPSRAHFVQRLAEQLPEAEIVWDQRNDRWDTGRRSLLTHHPDADAHLVIQDDVIPCRNLVAGATAAFDATNGGQPIALYTGKVRPKASTVTPAVKRALRIGAPWLEMRGPYWGPGLIIPTTHIRQIIDWWDRQPTRVQARVPNYDRRIEAWYTDQGIDCLYTVPSLVQHRAVDENPSLVKGRTGNRQAHAFIGDRDPCEIDWTRRAVRLDDALTFRNARSGRVCTVQVGTASARAMVRNPNWIEEEAPDADIPLAA
jgi:hypothetical protein